MTMPNETPRIFCIGRNYAAHARELDNELPDEPVVFCKPLACLVPSGQRINMPRHGEDLQFEAEVVVRIGMTGQAGTVAGALAFVEGLSLGLDLTMRDVQKELKARGLPWEKAKAFEASAPVGEFTPFTEDTDLGNIAFTCLVNGEIRQEGNTGDMLFSITALIEYLSRIWVLRKGDLIFTGTPSGVGSVKPGDIIEVENSRLGIFKWEMIP